MGLFSRKKIAQEKIYRRPEPRMPVNTQEITPNRNNYIIVILDSCRYDTFVTANPKTILKLGGLEKRYSYASWTAPSHYNLLMGLLPHNSPKRFTRQNITKKIFSGSTSALASTDLNSKTWCRKCISRLSCATSWDTRQGRWSPCPCSIRTRR